MEWFNDFYKNSMQKCPKSVEELMHGSENEEFLNANLVLYNNLAGSKQNWQDELKVKAHPPMLSGFFHVSLQYVFLAF